MAFLATVAADVSAERFDAQPSLPLRQRNPLGPVMARGAALEIRPAVAMLQQGRGLREVASIMGVSRTTLRRRLKEAGEWPVARVETAA